MNPQTDQALAQVQVPDNELTNYWAIVKRRKLSILLPLLLVGGIGIVIAFILPSQFLSQSVVLIERQSIPKDLIDTTVTGYVQEQIEQIRQRVASNANLTEIADKYNLYPTERARDPQEGIRLLRNGFKVATQDVSAQDPDRTGTRRATVSFTIDVTYPDAKKAQQITAELTKRFLADHQASRTEKAGEVIIFLKAEAETLKEEVTKMEAEIADFKQTEFSQLPELMNMNLRLFEKSEVAIAQTETTIRQINDKLDALRAELSLTEPYRDVQTADGNTIVSASKRLSSLAAEYLSLSDRYSAKHPDVIRLARQIRVLAEQSEEGARADEVLTQLVRQQEALREARGTYGEEHPQVLSLERSISALQRGLKSVIMSSSEPTGDSLPPDNPRYVAIQSSIQANESNRDAALSNLKKYKEDLAEYERRLFETPVVDNDLQAYMLEYEGARSKYKDLRAKLRSAQLALQLESGDNAERFVLASPAYLPVLPESPNRIAISALALMLGGIIGLLLGAVREFLDKTIRGSRAVSNSLGVPPLAVIPNIPLSPITFWADGTTK